MGYEEHVLHLENGLLAPDTNLTRVAKIAEDAIAHPGRGGIVIHFHGGLVPYNRGMDIAKELYDVYKIHGKGYPIFFVWESGLLETLTNNFSEIAKEAFFRLAWKRIEAIVKRKFEQGPMDRAAFTLPVTDTDAHNQAIDVFLDTADRTLLLGTEIAVPDGLAELSNFESLALENELALDGPLTLEIQKISNALLEPIEVEEQIRSRSPRVQGSSVTLMDPAALDKLVQRPEPGHRGIISTARMIKAVVAIAARVVRRFVQKRHHGFHATVVEEILRELYLANVGEAVWNIMKKDTTDSFHNDARVYGGTALLDAFRRKIDPARPPRITLIGHSTGAIYISEFLDKASSLLPDSVKYDVIFLAPASTFQLTAETLKAHKHLIPHFRMFTMKDAHEKEDQLVKYLYPCSLLYFISGVLEGGEDVPIVGMARYYDRALFPDPYFPAIKEVRDYVCNEDSRAVWSTTDDQAGEGRRSTSLHHGDFDNNGKTRESLAHILAQGF